MRGGLAREYTNNLNSQSISQIKPTNHFKSASRPARKWGFDMANPISS